MNSFALFLVCVQVFLIQAVYGQCGCAAPGPIYPGPGCPSYGPYYPGDVALPGQLYPAAYGIRVSGDNLKIDGTAQVSGGTYFDSSVQLAGQVDAEGAASLRNACCCGDAYLR